MSSPIGVFYGKVKRDERCDKESEFAPLAL